MNWSYGPSIADMEHLPPPILVNTHVETDIIRNDAIMNVLPSKTPESTSTSIMLLPITTSMLSPTIMSLLPPMPTPLVIPPLPHIQIPASLPLPPLTANFGKKRKLSRRGDIDKTKKKKKKDDPNILIKIETKSPKELAAKHKSTGAAQKRADLLERMIHDRAERIRKQMQVLKELLTERREISTLYNVAAKEAERTQLLTELRRDLEHIDSSATTTDVDSFKPGRPDRGDIVCPPL